MHYLFFRHGIIRKTQIFFILFRETYVIPCLKKQIVSEF